ncbi:hypothetical protein V6O07_02050 [Arthrospira platensis SPKY2]
MHHSNVEYISFRKSSFYCLIISLIIFYLNLESNSYQKYNIIALHNTKDSIFRLYDSYIPSDIKEFNQEKFVQFYQYFKEQDFTLLTQVDSILGKGEYNQLNKNEIEYTATNGKILIITYSEHGTVEDWRWK